MFRSSSIDSSRSEDESANEYEVCGSPGEELDSNSGWQEVISSEEVTTSDVTTEYWSAAAHPHLAHLPQLPHPLNSNITTVSGTVTVPSNVTITKKTAGVTKIGMSSINHFNISIQNK